MCGVSCVSKSVSAHMDRYLFQVAVSLACRWLTARPKNLLSQPCPGEATGEEKGVGGTYLLLCLPFPIIAPRGMGAGAAPNHSAEQGRQLRGSPEHTSLVHSITGMARV